MPGHPRQKQEGARVPGRAMSEARGAALPRSPRVRSMIPPPGGVALKLRGGHLEAPRNRAIMVLRCSPGTRSKRV